MHKKIIKVRKSDHFRAILTDTLPYEVPLLFSNEGFYHFLKKHGPKALDTACKFSLFADQKYTIPYNYKIKKNPTEFRSLSVMHPCQQIAVADFYRKYSGAILAQCKKSKWSLRAPSSVASYYVEKSRVRRPLSGRSKGIEAKSDGFSSVSRTASSFYSYEKYTLLHKFFESSEFHDLEKRFSLLLKLDITQCFGRIYTHTIGWAVKSKDYAKRNSRGSSTDNFESNFDRLMQCSNYNETAGIIVGPEVSRVFAESILQQIDLDIEKSLLEHNPPLSCGLEYEIRRYVDDYFVFSNSKENLSKIQLCISECLHPYRLSLNDSKTVTMERPFSTAETSARMEIASTISETFDRAIKTEDVVRPPLINPETVRRAARIRSSSDLANSTIRDIKKHLKTHNATFDTSSNYFLAALKRLVWRYTGKMKESLSDSTQIDSIANFLLAILDILFFLYASSPRVRQTYLTSEIVLAIIDFARLGPGTFSERIFTKISQEIKFTTTRGFSSNANDNIEALNLLTVLQTLGGNYGINSQQLCTAFGLDNIKKGKRTVSHLGYFQLVSALYICNNEIEYQPIKDLIIERLKDIFADEFEWFHRADLTMLLLDISSCPFLNIDDKTAIVKAALVHKGNADLNARAKNFLEIAAREVWFFNWSKEVRLDDVLKRKQLRTPY
ncbi:hypothetical protein HNP55_004460 [Paucibacter oligotrophus]|uniref:Reverse transcriptase domain-containing protein n=1 Tax=Roseateles oligotrophus TaxID=1769250 RepID=A0A840LCL9_9BURK|nr:antiviral reverse transcriptase Drt3b [Roseateles oligotrophus]MBB4845906.1 hypothetical protein [Roseateles oligotrophus]